MVLVISGTAAWLTFRTRSEHTEAAIDIELLGNRRVTVDSLNLSTHHVICTTDLQTGDPLYISPSLVYGYRYGFGHPQGLHLSTAVQASACVPGAFNPRVIPTAPFGMDHCNVDDLVLNDGGTYDNMADQWTYDYAERAKIHPALSTLQPPTDFLVIVNASEGWEGVKPVSRRPFALELAGLLRSEGVQYDVSTARRRQALYRSFVQAEAIGEGLIGAFAQIGSSPYAIIDDFSTWAGHGEPPTLFLERQQRAQAAEQFLNDAGYNREWWAAVAGRNAAVPTTLAKLNHSGGPNVTAELLEHGYVLTVVNLHVLYRLVPLGTLDRNRFARLCSGHLNNVFR